MVMNETIEGRILIGYWINYEGWRSRWSTLEIGGYQEAGTSNDQLQDETGFEPKFEALSYTWGSSADPDTVLVLDEAVEGEGEADQGTEIMRQLNVTQNLAIALKHLRYANKSRRMWIDAICIDQVNTAERNEQVQRMKNIFKAADRVVWLGPSSGDSGLALSTLEYIGKQVEYTTEDSIITGPDATEHWWHQRLTALPYDEVTWQSVYDLLTRPWFDRIWIVQEIQLANTRAVVHCGKDQISWYLLRRGIRCLVNRARGVPSSLNDCVIHVSTMCDNMLGQSLPQLLSMNTA